MAKRTKHILKSKYKIIILATVLIFVVIFATAFLSKNFWWRFSTGGEIYSNPVMTKGLIFFGNNAGDFYAVDTRSGKQKWVFHTIQEVFSRPLIKRGRVFINSSGEVYALKIKNGQVLWQFSADENFRFYSDLGNYKDILYIGDSNGTLYALDTGSGKLKWKFTQESVSQITDILVGQWLNWFGNFEIKGKTVYLAGRDGVLYALAARNGKLRWKFDSGETITTPLTLSGGRIYFGNKSGNIYVVDGKNGNLVRSEKEQKEVVACVQEIGNIFPWEKRDLIITYQNGITIRESSNGKKAWKLEGKEKNIACPVIRHSRLYITNTSGFISAININTGEEKWKYKTSGEIQVDPIVLRRGLKSVIVVPDTEGVYYAINTANGKPVWIFKAFGGILTKPIIHNSVIYFTSTDGGLYKINKNSGKVIKPLYIFYQIKVKQEFRPVGDSQISEWTIKFDESLLTNPWKEVDIRMELTPSSGGKISINGFYYDKNTWKVRFNPPQKGEWQWELKFELADRIITKKGTFHSETDTQNAFIKISGQNPKRLTLNGETVFNGLGIGEEMLDYNANGNPFDDWALGNSNPIIINGPYGKSFFRSDKITDLPIYLSEYGSQGAGFNLYRVSLENVSFSLWSDRRVHSHLNSLESKYADVFIEALINRNYQVWMTIFGFYIPFNDSMRPIEKRMIKDYIKYVVARYGAYVSVWEVANEAYVQDEVVKYVADEMKKIDFQKRPISMSLERSEMPEIDIISPHWYVSEKVEVSDLSVLSIINKYSKVNKPVIFGEQGNSDANWDSTSAIRMRVRSWTAFFNEAILIFWNKSDNKDYLPTRHNNGNMYIGEEERNYMKVLQNFSSGVNITARKISLPTNNVSIRSYGLKSDKETLGYFYHFSNHAYETTFNLKFSTPRAGTLSWIDPSSGKVLSSQKLISGSHTISAPVFLVDLALKVTYDE